MSRLAPFCEVVSLGRLWSPQRPFPPAFDTGGAVADPFSTWGGSESLAPPGSFRWSWTRRRTAPPGGVALEDEPALSSVRGGGKASTSSSSSMGWARGQAGEEGGMRAKPPAGWPRTGLRIPMRPRSQPARGEAIMPAQRDFAKRSRGQGAAAPTPPSASRVPTIAGVSGCARGWTEASTGGRRRGTQGCPRRCRLGGW